MREGLQPGLLVLGSKLMPLAFLSSSLQDATHGSGATLGLVSRM